MDRGRPAEAPSTASAPAETPSDYSLILPDGWYRIPLDPEQCARSVDALLERQFKGTDNQPHAKRQARDALLDEADRAIGNGGIEMYLCLQEAGPITLPASLLVTLAPDACEPDTSLEEVSRDLAHHGPVGTEATVENLPSGPAVRTRSRTESARDETTGEVVYSTAVDYYLPVPGTTSFLVLSFSTPLDMIADALVGLFDAVAKAFTWRGMSTA
ncbi:hypothetical protein SXIM_16900 [Streptomyces xiamenensis]|uniref:Uncharacterized protein n=1 Tax=Streptomyces xiamenensis TaxID=408015 RepID=A0A0F7FSE4_9ACTN|nr:hypothetical protein SXIM_16900 [Streptomyces xiamenensis]